MDRGKLSSWLRKRWRGTSLAALVICFSGLGLVLLPAHDQSLWLVGIPFLFFGAALLVWAAWPRTPLTSHGPPTLASKLLYVATLRGRLYPFFPALGLCVFALDVGYNAALSASPSFLTEDIVVLLGAAALVGYRFIPMKFSRERDFVLIFFFILNMVLVVPLLVSRAYYRDPTTSVDIYSWAALAPEISAILNAIGVQNRVHAISGSSAPGLSFVPLSIPAGVTVVITTSCSGLYSFAIFASAFLSFTLTEHRTVTRNVWALLGLGFLTSYVANLLRMVIIVLVGYYLDTPQTDLQNMLIAHSYLGWLIFLGWISLFWTTILKLFPMENPATLPGNLRPHGKESETLCKICAGTLTPSIAATRCVCGTFFHRQCIENEIHCPSCGRSEIQRAPTTSSLP